MSLVHAHRRYTSTTDKNDASTQPILMSGSRVVVPTSLRSKVLKTLHFCHPGIVRMKALARQHVYWPGIDSENKQLVRSCSQCARSASQPVKHELTPWPETNECWSRIHIDYAGPTEGKMLLVVVDSHSKWLDVGIVPKADTAATIIVLRRLFALHGLCSLRSLPSSPPRSPPRSAPHTPRSPPPRAATPSRRRTPPQRTPPARSPSPRQPQPSTPRRYPQRNRNATVYDRHRHYRFQLDD